MARLGSGEVEKAGELLGEGRSASVDSSECSFGGIAVKVSISAYPFDHSESVNSTAQFHARVRTQSSFFAPPLPTALLSFLPKPLTLPATHALPTAPIA